MTMFHHDNRDLNTAINEAREYLARDVQTKAQRARNGLQALNDRVIVDTLSPISDVRYDLSPGGIAVNGKPITSQAFGQLCTKAQVPVAFARKLLNHESQLVRNLAIENFETLSATSSDIVMLRTVNGVHHGVVTDAYKRMDMKLVAGSFGEAIQLGKLIPVQCDLSATRVYVRALMPRIYGAEFGEALCFGVTLRGSDFGFGKVEVDPFCNRVWCSNKAQMSLKLGRGFSKTHRGARLTEETFQLSAETQGLQALAMASELRDSVSALLSDKSIDMYVGAIGRCFAEGQRGGQYEAEKEIEKLVKAARMTEKVASFVQDAFRSKDRDVVPQVADGRWKLAQAVAYAAQYADIADADTRMDLEYLAGEIVESAPAGAILAAAN